MPAGTIHDESTQGAENVAAPAAPAAPPPAAGDAVGDVEAEREGVVVGDKDGEFVRLPLAVVVGEPEALLVSVAEGEGEGDVVIVPLREFVDDCVGELVPLVVDVGQLAAESVPLGEGEPVAEEDTDGGVQEARYAIVT